MGCVVFPPFFSRGGKTTLEWLFPGGKTTRELFFPRFSIIRKNIRKNRKKNLKRFYVMILNYLVINLCYGKFWRYFSLNLAKWSSKKTVRDTVARIVCVTSDLETQCPTSIVIIIHVFFSLCKKLKVIFGCFSKKSTKSLI